MIKGAHDLHFSMLFCEDPAQSLSLFAPTLNALSVLIRGTYQYIRQSLGSVRSLSFCSDLVYYLYNMPAAEKHGFLANLCAGG
jgi:hypothetical protein